MFAQLFGIDHVMDTVVGDQQLKGISGGQRRRVTIGAWPAHDESEQMRSTFDTVCIGHLGSGWECRQGRAGHRHGEPMN